MVSKACITESSTGEPWKYKASGSSDHKYISYTFASRNRIEEDNYTTNSRRLDARKLNANRLILEVDRFCSRVKLSDDERTRVEQIMEIIGRGL